MSTQTIDFNNVDSVKYNDEFIDILKLNDLQIWERARWFTYTGIDANGNYEGTQAYDGTPVAYGIGKPTTIEYTTTTDLDGNEIVTETITWDNANGLNDDYFKEKYGDEYVKGWNNEDEDPIQVVEDILVIPDTHNGLPITTLLNESFYIYSYDDAYSHFRQPYFYRGIVWGKNLTTLEEESLYGISYTIDNAITGVSPSKFTLPPTVTKYGKHATSYTGTNGSKLDILEVTANQFEGVLDDCSITVVFDSSVAKITASGHSKTNFVFEHSNDDPIEIDFSAGSSAKSASTLNIYTDNDYIKNYDWSTNANITPTFYSLSEWTEA